MSKISSPTITKSLSECSSSPKYQKQTKSNPSSCKSGTQQINPLYCSQVGQQTFRSVVRSFYKGVSAILLIYSIDNKQSFIELSGWLKQIRQNSHPQALIFLVGAKLDLQDSQTEIRKVTTEQGKRYKNSIDADGFLEVSAKTGENVKQKKLFQKLSRSLVKKYNDSSVFKCLVTPLSTQDTPSKAQSFVLKYDAIAKRSVVRRQKTLCC